MRRTALLVAAQPRAYDGPWVPLGDRSGTWRYTPKDNFSGSVVIEVIDGVSPVPLQLPLNGMPVEFAGSKARARILGEVDARLVTVNIERIG